jgi:hypothetical protein
MGMSTRTVSQSSACAQIAVLDIWSDVIMPELNQLLFKTGEMARGQAEIAWHVFAFG